MNTYDITPIIENIHKTVETHRVGVGAYARWLWQNENGDREMGVNPYGCADAANILYSIGAFPKDPMERAEWGRVMQEMQGEDGQFHERTHYPLHTTAHCIAALELFDAKPSRPCTALLPYLQKEKLYELLDGLNWTGNPWTDSHLGAGIYVALHLSDAADAQWCRDYFAWFYENADPETGFWVGPRASNSVRTARTFMYMAGGFHYLFNHEYAHMPLRYPERVIDTCIALYDGWKVGLSSLDANNVALRENFGTHADFLEIDWIYCMTRAQQQTSHRYDEVRQRLEDFTEFYMKFWENVDWEHDESVNDLHMLFGGVCGLAELSRALRGVLVSEIPLKLVLDRRPFI